MLKNGRTPTTLKTSTSQRKMTSVADGHTVRKRTGSPPKTGGARPRKGQPKGHGKKEPRNGMRTCRHTPKTVNH